MGSRRQRSAFRLATLLSAAAGTNTTAASACGSTSTASYAR
jgi:hypothetical protein